MDYKKKYEELVGKIEKAYLFAQTNSTKAVLEEIRPELKESDDERIKNVIYGWIYIQPSQFFDNGFSKEEMLAWLEKQGEQKPTLPKWRYKKDNTPLLRDSLILNKYGCVVKSPSGALVSDVWVIDYDELAKLPKEEFEKQSDQPQGKTALEAAKEEKVDNQNCAKPADKVEPKFHEGDIIKPKDGGHESWQIIQVDISDKKYRFKNGYVIHFSQEDAYELVEQKHAYNIEPKFKVGEWLTENHPNSYARFVQILEIVNVQGKNRYRISRDLHNDEDIAECRFVEDNWHPFNIQDAKDGDVLATSAGAFIYNGNNGGGSCPGSYCGINSLGRFQTGVKTHWTWKNVCPATKEQRDTLEKAMADAGWKFDFEKKKLKKIEQKPAWSEEDEKTLQGIWDEILANKHDAKEYEWKTYDRFLDWLKSIKDRVGCEANFTTTWKPSEEQIQCLHDAIEHYQTNGYPASKLNELYEQMSKIYKL